MQFDSRSRWLFAGFAVLAFALLGEAMVLQHFKGQAPCPLCVLQRAAYVSFALIALVAAVQRPLRRGTVAYLTALTLVALVGAGIAMRHVWVLYHPKFGCGIDVLEQFVNDLPTAKLLPWLFHANGECTAPHAPILGLQVPEWSLIWFGVLFFGALVFALRSWSALRATAQSRV